MLGCRREGRRRNHLASGRAGEASNGTRELLLASGLAAGGLLLLVLAQRDSRDGKDKLLQLVHLRLGGEGRSACSSCRCWSISFSVGAGLGSSGRGSIASRSSRCLLVGLLLLILLCLVLHPSIEVLVVGA